MCLPFLNLFVRYDALLRGWCVAYVGDASVTPCTEQHFLSDISEEDTASITLVP
jgi:hypothetical protein